MHLDHVVTCIAFVPVLSVPAISTPHLSVYLLKFEKWFPSIKTSSYVYCFSRSSGNNVFSYCYIEPPPLTSLWAILHCIGNMKVDLFWEVMLFFLPVTFCLSSIFLTISGMYRASDVHVCIKLTFRNLCLYRSLKVNSPPLCVLK